MPPLGWTAVIRSESGRFLPPPRPLVTQPTQPELLDKPLLALAQKVKHEVKPEVLRHRVSIVGDHGLTHWTEALEASYDMIVLWLCPPCFHRLEEEEQRNHWSLWWNPLFWLSYLPLALCVLSGKWIHSLWGQGGRVRPDEEPDEMRARMHWIYAMDGPIASLTLLDLIDVLFDLPNYEQRKFQADMLSWTITLGVTSAYVLANSYFISAMKHRSLVGVRLVIVCQTVFAVGLLNMLVAGAIRNKSSRRFGNDFFETWLEFATWCTRLTMVRQPTAAVPPAFPAHARAQRMHVHTHMHNNMHTVVHIACICGLAISRHLSQVGFMLGAAFVYSRLWNVYKADYRATGEVLFHMHGRYLRRECERYAIIPIAAVLMWTLLLVAYYNDDDLFWDALV